MIAPVPHGVMRSLQEVFPEHCLKATPDPQFLSNLYGFDMSLCPHQPSLARTSHVTEIFKETFDAINSTSRVPELLVWMKSQVCSMSHHCLLFILNDFYSTSIETP